MAGSGEKISKFVVEFILLQKNINHLKRYAAKGEKVQVPQMNYNGERRASGKCCKQIECRMLEDKICYIVLPEH